MDKKVLIIRFSALGDVAMSLPVIVSFARQHPQIRVYVLSKKGFSSIFSNIEDNIYFVGADFQNEHRGIKGLLKLFSQIKRINPDVTLDLHAVLRTFLIRTLLILNGKKVFGIHKGKLEKKAATRKNNKILKPLKTVFERYADVIRNAGFSFQIDSDFTYKLNGEDFSNQFPAFNSQKVNIGIAPFAKHQGKIYPLSKMFELIKLLINDKNYQIYLFGGGQDEMKQLQMWQASIPELTIVAGKFSLKEELFIMKSLNLMISMDSANMHLASLMGTRVISIWGATHPYTGFSPWNQSEKDIIQLDLECRPCSVFGNKACFRKDYACLNGIEPNMIYNKILEGK